MVACLSPKQKVELRWYKGNGGRRPELAVVMPGAEQQGTHCLIRLSESRATAVFLQGFKDVFLEDSRIVTQPPELNYPDPKEDFKTGKRNIYF